MATTVTQLLEASDEQNLTKMLQNNNLHILVALHVKFD